MNNQDTPLSSFVQGMLRSRAAAILGSLGSRALSTTSVQRSSAQIIPRFYKAAGVQPNPELVRGWLSSDAYTNLPNWKRSSLQAMICPPSPLIYAPAAASNGGVAWSLRSAPEDVRYVDRAATRLRSTDVPCAARRDGPSSCRPASSPWPSPQSGSSRCGATAMLCVLRATASSHALW